MRNLMHRLLRYVVFPAIVLVGIQIWLAFNLGGHLEGGYGPPAAAIILGGDGGGGSRPVPRATVSVDRTGDALRVDDPRMDALARLPPDSTDRVAFIAYSYVPADDGGDRLRRFLLAAVDTWAAPQTPDTERGDRAALYVVFSETSRGPFETYCGVGGVGDDANATYDGRAKLCRHLRPIYVDCPEWRVGESPCCKQQKGLAEIIGGWEYPLYDWYVFLDDDIYLRKEYLARLLLRISPPDFPMLVVQRGSEPLSLGKSGYLERHEKQCSIEKNFQYPWAQPAIYSRGAMLLMAKGYRAGSLVKQCNEYNVSHDVGNAILNWMYSLPVRTIPLVSKLPLFRDDFIGSHWAGRDDPFLEPLRARTATEMRRNMKSFSFYEVHEHWNSFPTPSTSGIINSPFQVKWYKNVTGFRSTQTHKSYGEPWEWGEGVWHTLDEFDCHPLAQT